MSHLTVKLQRCLDEGHNLYTLQDVLERIRDGRMQSFCNGDSWLVTEILNFPTGKVLQLSMVVAENLQATEDLQRQAQDFAASIGARLIRAIGRPGWAKLCKTNEGWQHSSNIYVKEVR